MTRAVPTSRSRTMYDHVFVQQTAPGAATNCGTEAFTNQTKRRPDR